MAELRASSAADAAALAAIYNPYIRDSVATFEETPLGATAMRERLAQVQAQRLPWLVATVDDRVVGYSYATAWRTRSAYRYSVESTVYLAPDAQRQGHGRALMQALLDALQPRGVHCVIAGISLPNPGSVALHEALGFAPVARFPEVGYKFARWVDVGYWQRLLPG